MATGVCKVSVEGGSEETFEYICTSCKDTKIVEAEKYCQDCDEHYCLICVDLHKRFPALRNHVILNREDVANWREQTKIPTLPTETCDRHPGKLVELFCGQHKELCCNMCVSLYHRICEGMVFIAEAANGIDESQDFKAVNDNLWELKADLEKTSSKQQGSLENSRCQIFKQIAAFRKRTNELFDDLEKKVTDEMDMLVRDSSSRHNEYQKACDNILQEIKQLQQLLESTRQTNDPQTFINMKKCQFQITRVHQAIEELTSHHGDELLFDMDLKLENLHANIQSLGTVTIKSSTPKPVKIFQSAVGHLTLSKGGNQSQVVQSNFGQTNSNVTHVQEVGPLKVSQHKNYNIKMKSDKKLCSIEGIWLMKDGSILLTDYRNCKIKRLDSSYQITDQLVMPFEPFQICPIDDHESIVPCEDNLITFVSVQQSEMQIKKSFRLSHYCIGVAYANGKIFVSDCEDKVYIHTIDGKHLKTVKIYGDRQNIFSKARKLSSSLDGTKIFVADENKGLIILDHEGDLVASLNDKNLKGAESVFVDSNGRVIVCSNSNSIMQLKEGSITLCEVVQYKSYENPIAVCIDHKRNKMIVAFWNNNYIRVYDLKK